MADIGPLTARLVASAQGVNEGLEQMKKMMSSAASTMGAAAEKLGNSTGGKIAAGIVGALKGLPNLLKNSLSGGFQALESVINEPLKATITLLQRIPVVGGLLSLPFEGMQHVLDRFNSEMANVLQLGVFAERAGVDIGRLNDLAVAADFAGIADGANKVSAALFRMQLNLANAAIQGSNVASKFDDMAKAIGNVMGISEGGKAAAALKALGLDVVALTAGDAVEAFEKILFALAGLESQFVRSKLAMDIFSIRGRELMPLINQIEMVGKARESVAFFGSGVSGADLASVRRVQLARKQLEQFWAGINSQILSAVAPILAELADKVSPFAKSFSGLTDKILVFAEKASWFIGLLVDSFSDVDKIRDTWGSLFMWLRGQIEWLLAQIPILLGKTLNLLAEGRLGYFLGKEPGKALIGLGQDMADLAKTQISGNAAALKAMIKDFATTDLGKNLAAFWEGVHTRINSVGVAAKANDPFAIWAESANRLAGQAASPIEQLISKVGEVEAMTKRIDDLMGQERELGIDLDPFGQGLVSAAFDPEKIRRMEEERKKFADIIGPQAISEAFLKMQDQLAGKTLAGSAIQAGSKEAFSAMMRHLFKPSESVQEKIRSLMEDAKRQREESIRIGQEVRQAVNQIANEVQVGPQ